MSRRRWFPSAQQAPWAHGWPGKYPPRKLWRRLRWRILNRDGFTCQYCRKTLPPGGLNVDHVIPVKRGGKSIPSNLVTACRACNKEKGNKNLPKAQVKELDRGLLQKPPSKENVNCDSCGARGTGYQTFNAEDPDYWMCGRCFGFLIAWKRKEAGR